MNTQLYQVVSYSGRTSAADDLVWNGEDWTRNWRDAQPVSLRTAEVLVEQLDGHGHVVGALVGKQKFFPF
jgi:hypothetical protein